jgi:hypothetical protein
MLDAYLLSHEGSMIALNGKLFVIKVAKQTGTSQGITSRLRCVQHM